MAYAGPELQEEPVMTKILIAFFSRADENYFAGAMRYVKVGNTEIVCGIIKDLTGGDSLDSNIQLVYNNARLAAKIANAYTRL